MASSSMLGACQRYFPAYEWSLVSRSRIPVAHGVNNGRLLVILKHRPGWYEGRVFYALPGHGMFVGDSASTYKLLRERLSTLCANEVSHQLGQLEELLSQQALLAAVPLSSSAKLPARLPEKILARWRIDR